MKRSAGKFGCCIVVVNKVNKVNAPTTTSTIKMMMMMMMMMPMPTMIVQLTKCYDGKLLCEENFSSRRRGHGHLHQLILNGCNGVVVIGPIPLPLPMSRAAQKSEKLKQKTNSLNGN